MSATLERLHRPEAVAIARAFVDALDGTYEQLVVAGSLRRRLAFIGDVEIVAVPRREVVSGGLFGDEPVEADLLAERLADLLDAGAVEKRARKDGRTMWGPAWKSLVFRGAPVDLFTPEAARFGWILALRTGPAAFSRQLVLPRRDEHTGRWLKTKDGRPGLLPEHVRPRDGWLTYRASGEKIPTPTERDVFALLGVPYAEPWERL